MNLQLENKLRGVESDRPGDCRKGGLALEQNPTFQEEPKTSYTCPMHPEIRQDQPGYCPICGMALEPVTVTNEPEADNAEAKDMTRRFWIATFGKIFSLPLFTTCSACPLLPVFSTLSLAFSSTR